MMQNTIATLQPTTNNVVVFVCDDPSLSATAASAMFESVLMLCSPHALGAVSCGDGVRAVGSDAVDDLRNVKEHAFLVVLDGEFLASSVLRSISKFTTLCPKKPLVVFVKPIVDVDGVQQILSYSRTVANVVRANTPLTDSTRWRSNPSVVLISVEDVATWFKETQRGRCVALAVWDDKGSGATSELLDVAAKENLVSFVCCVDKPNIPAHATGMVCDVLFLSLQGAPAAAAHFLQVLREMGKQPQSGCRVGYVRDKRSEEHAALWAQSYEWGRPAKLRGAVL